MRPDRRWWPIDLTEGAIRLRPLRRRDSRVWASVRELNADWLRQWEATSPDPSGYTTFAEMVRSSNRMAREGQSYSLAIWLDDRFAGQITLGCVVWGSMRSGALGYWVDEAVAGRGVAPTAVAMLTDHAFFTLGLHRVEINVRPENQPSLRVPAKLGFRDEGVRERFLHINGQWRDHRTFALTVEDAPGGLLREWRQGRERG